MNDNLDIPRSCDVVNKNSSVDEEVLPSSVLVENLRQSFNAAIRPVIKDVIVEYGYAEDSKMQDQLPDQLADKISALVCVDFPLIYHSEEQAYYMYSRPERVFLDINRDVLVETGFAFFAQAQKELQQEGKPFRVLMQERKIKASLKEGLRPYLGETNGRAEHDLLVFRNKIISLKKDYTSDLQSVNGFEDCAAPDGTVFNTQTLNADFVAVSERPRIWEQALLSMGFDTPDMMEAVEDILLYLMSPSLAREEMFYFYGIGSNGKSVLIKFLMEVVGRRHVAAVSLDDLQKSDFAWEPLINKRLNLPAESGSSGFMDSEKLKAVITGDAIAINRKNRPIVSVVLPIKFVFAANRLPVFAEKTHAMYRRFCLLRFDKIIDGSEQIQDFHKMLLDQRNEIASWWLISHLRRNGAFNPKFKLPEIFETWRLDAMQGEGDVVSMFIQAQVVFTGDLEDIVTTADLIKAFKAFCREEDISSTSRWGENIYGRKLHEGFVLEAKRSPNAKLAAEGSAPITRNGKTQRYYRGLSVISK